ncbi:MAG: hypothetical protein MK200_05790, partial [Nitrosopumilus sp.]|nr:hypothetical protein [Nitrosopumilus sp.]
ETPLYNGQLDYLSNNNKQKGTKRKLNKNENHKAMIQRNNVTIFWHENYEFEDEDREIKASDIYAFFCSTKYYQGEDFTSFSYISTAITTLKSTTQARNKVKYYYANPRNQICSRFHNDPNNSPIDKINIGTIYGITSKAPPMLNKYKNIDSNPIRNIPNTTKSLHLLKPYNRNQGKAKDIDKRIMVESTRKETSPDLSTNHAPKKNHSLKYKTKLFLQTNYLFNDVTCQPTLLQDIYQLYIKMVLKPRETLSNFKATSGLLQVKTRTKDNYFVIPKSKEAKKHQQISHQRTNGTQTISLNLLNIDGLITNKRNKSQFLTLITKNTCNSSIIGITESWTQENQHYDAEILKHFPGYNITRADRNLYYNLNDPNQLTSRGGCLLLTSPDIAQKPIKKISNGNCEMVIVELPELGISVIVVYNPPEPNFALSKFNQMLDEIKEYLHNRHNEDEIMDTIIMGDFNFPPKIVVWEPKEKETIPLPKSGYTEQKQAFKVLMDIATDYGLSQLVNKPTRGNNILDLVFTDIPEIFSECITTSQQPISDHHLVKFTLITNEVDKNLGNGHKVNCTEIGKYYIKMGNLPALKMALNDANWGIQRGNYEQASQNYQKALLEAVQRAKVPLYKKKKGIEKNKKTESIQAKTKSEKQLLHADIRERDKETKTQELSNLNAQILQELSAQQQKQEEWIIKHIKSNPKLFYKHAAKNRKERAKIGPLKTGDSYINDPQKMAEILSVQYETVFSKPKTPLEPHQIRTTQCTPLQDIQITDEDITQAIQEMKSDTAPGPDGIPVALYKLCADEITKPIKEMWTISLDIGKMPENIITSIITPVYKGGIKEDPGNYRPIALTNHITKIFERILRKSIVAHLEQNNLINETQHGFRSGRATITQLINYYDTILSMLEQRNHVDAIYLDFAKAFDRVDHGILMQKINGLNITGKIATWIYAFLTQRQQMVRVEGHFSRKVWVTSGVPQGSVLGPVLFLIMMNNITDNIASTSLASFADDTRIWRDIHGEENAQELQHDLNSLYEWARNNNMDLKHELRQTNYTVGNLLTKIQAKIPLKRKSL